jgi:hypothetical protein
MNNVYILLELAKLDSEVYNLLMRASKPFNAFINSNVGLRAIIRDSFLKKTVYAPGHTSYTFKRKLHRLDGPAVITTGSRYAVLVTVEPGRAVQVKEGTTARSWWQVGEFKRTEITDSRSEPSD